jgi:FemAB-related protein (PEP-CTERM system-associated)
MLTDTVAQAFPSMLRQETVSVGRATDGEAAEWDAFVAGRSWAGYHDWRWRGVFERAFGHRSIYLAARRGGNIEGVLPLVFMQSAIFGRALHSLPFLNYGGISANSSETARALLDAAIDLARELRCRHLELRHTARQFENLPCRQHKVTMLLQLKEGMWERIDRKVRNQIRKAEKSALTSERGGAELARDFYSVFSRNMRDLGTPVYSRRFFDEVLTTFPERTRVHVVRLDGHPIAAALTYRTGERVEVPWASSLREHNSRCPNHLLYWGVIEAALAGGSEILDFGRSSPHEGTYRFKEQWGAEPTALHWEYYLADGDTLPDMSPKNPKFHAAVAIWKRSPLWLANAVGPHIVRLIP